jgi:hypothetical protein
LGAVVAPYFFADTLANTIRGYDYDPATRNIANARSFFQDFARGRMVLRSMRKAISTAAMVEGAWLASLPTAR